jgi:hypothetical protein
MISSDDTSYDKKLATRGRLYPPPMLFRAPIKIPNLLKII